MTATESIGRSHPEVEPTEFVIPITYSSRLENGRVIPSRLSVMAFDAAQRVSANQKEAGQKPAIIIAGEQSFRSNTITTSEALVAALPAEPNVPITLLNNADNRLLNTVLQVNELANHLQSVEHQAVPLTTVAWGFHINRLKLYYGWRGLVSSFVTVEQVITEMELPQEEFSERYDFKPDITWETIREAMAREFAWRERYTYGISLIGRGWLLNLYSKLINKGRYDDITADGRVIRSHTTQ